MKIPSFINIIGEKLLYSWIKTDASFAQELYLDTNKKLFIYVVQSRAWSDLLVLQHESRIKKNTLPLSKIKHPQLKKYHHIYTVAHSQPLKAWLQNETKHSAMLSEIKTAMTEHDSLDVIFVPVVVFWGRPILKQKHWLRVLFSDTWGFAGITRRFFTILFNGKNTLVQFSSPISYRQVLEQSNSKNFTDTLQEYLSQRLIEIKTATLGPDTSHRRTLVHSLLNNSDVMRAIEDKSQRAEISIYQSKKIAQSYLNEIVADKNYITIQILQRILSTFWNKFYDGINVNHTDELKQLALSHELVYIPCHRSHIDYLLLSYVIHSQGLALPSIAAGKNLNLPIIGSILRKGGAFFIRRSFKNNPLYSTIMFEYFASQISSNVSVEYFIEGGRSRTGRLLQARVGMLSMSIRAFLKYQKKPLAFIPVYISYEKMIEGKSYTVELSGGRKQSESFFSSIKSFFSIRGFYGTVTTNFGKAVFLDDILQKSNANWQSQPYDDNKRPPWLRTTVGNTAQLVMQNINACCHVNNINLISTALLAAPKQAMDENELASTISFYTKLITSLNYSKRVTVTTQSAEQQISHGEKLQLIQRREHELGDFIFLNADNAIHLTYYRNNILHLLALPSLVACCFNNVSVITKETILNYFEIAYPFLQAEFFLPWHVEQLEPVIKRTLLLLCNSGFIRYVEHEKHYVKQVTRAEQPIKLSSLARVISPVLEIYYMIFALLAEHKDKTLSRARLEQLCYLMAQRVSLIYKINSPDFFDKRLISNFINSLIENNFVSVNNSEKLILNKEALEQGRLARRLLERDMQNNILQMLRSFSSTKN